MEQSSSNKQRVTMTKTDLDEIRSLALKLYVDLDQRKLKMDESQFKTYCYVQATQAWLRMRGFIKIILD